MYEFEKYPEQQKYIQEMANTGKAPKEWSSFLIELDKALIELK